MTVYTSSAGFYTPSLLSVFLVVIFVAALFGSRMLNRPQQVPADEQVQYSARYLELAGRQKLNEDEKAEFELESCRFERDSIRFILSKPLANHDAAISKYRQRCEQILPLTLTPE